MEAARLMADDRGNVVKFPVQLRRYRFRDEITIPRRPWLMRNLLLRRYLTILIAAGGTGKSIFTLIALLHLAAGRDFGPFKCIGGPKRVAILSVEEDQDELDRRLHAIRKVYDFSNDDAANLFLIGVDSPLLATADRRGNIMPTPMVQKLENELSRLVIEAVGIDPLIETWQGNENDNSQMRAAVAIIRNICRNIDAAGLLNHHVGKGLVTPGDVNAGRGASSLGGLVRIAYTMTNMTKDEAAALSVPNPKGIVRVDGAKANYLPPPENAEWYQFKSVELDNGESISGETIAGDYVGVLKPWVLPGIFDGLSYQKIDAILDAITAGTPDHERWTLAPQSKDRFVGKIIAEVGEISEERASRIAATWKKSGLLYEDEYLSGAQRRKRKGAFVDVSKRPSAIPETD